MDTIKKYASPRYWQEKINADQNSELRKSWMAEVKDANQLLTNKLDLGIKTSDPYETSTWMKTFQHVGGRIFYGKLGVKVEGVERDDDEIARMYEAGINWEFTQPRGMYQRIGRREIRPAGENWISYGMGAMNTYWDPTAKSKENPTGSIINESLISTDLILDSSVKRFQDIGRISRKFQKTKAEVENEFPFLDPEKIPHKDGDCWLFEVQFRCPTTLRGKVSTSELREATGDDRYVWPENDRDEIESRYRKAFKGSKKADSEKMWNELKPDITKEPAVYTFQFLSDRELVDESEGDNYLPIYKEARYVGKDFTYTLAPFLFQPNTPYPSGAAKFIYGDQRYEALLMTLYMEMLRHLNNSGVGVDLDRIHGTTDDEKLERIRKFVQEGGYPLPLSGDVNAALTQLRRSPPPREMLIAAERSERQGEDFFQSHGEQTGEIPYAGTPYRAMALAQSSAASLMAHMVDTQINFVETVYRKTGTLLYRFMPKDKVVRLTRTTKENKQVALVKSKMLKYDPQNLDIIIGLDTDTDMQKAQKEQKVMWEFQMGLRGPKSTLEGLGEEDAEEILEENQKYQRGQMIVAVEEENPGLKDAINTAIQTHLMKKGSGYERKPTA